MILLFEIGTEELPPGEIDTVLAALREHVRAGAEAARLPIGGVFTYATPRRLALRVEGIAYEAETIEETVTGPAARIAFDADGNPTKAAIGFARGKGVDPSQLTRVETDKGEYVALTVRREGEASSVVMARLLTEAISALPWKKAMRWGWSPVAFGRPIHWMVAMLDSRVLDVEFAGVKAGATTYGHRFLAPDAITLNTASQYGDALRKAKVLVDIDERKKVIEEGVARLAAEEGLTAVSDPELVDEVVQLVEWPVPMIGRFAEDLLEVPREVLIESMRSHQRYFATESADGALANGFIFIANMEVPDPKVVVHGNLRVLRARLEDAKFFYREDRKHTLEAQLGKLASVRYIDGLGSIRDRADRLVALSATLAETLFPGDGDVATHAGRAALLCKADLVTGMVGEFASLQGTMGRYYAVADGEAPEVAAAIEEHYAPRGAWDAPAEAPASVIVSLADKFDAIAGCFALGLIPTGSADPYGLRRAALGILRTGIDRNLRLPLRSLLEAAVSALPDPAAVGSSKTLRPAAEVVDDALEFLHARLRAMLAANAPTDIADAVVAVIGDELPTAPARAAVLDRMRKDADFEPLAAAFKRAVNIVTKAVDDDPSLAALYDAPAPDEALLTEDAERALWAAMKEAEPTVTAGIAASDFDPVGAALSGLKPAIDGFFDHVMVNADDDAVRRNRLALLAAVRALFRRFADISRIQADGR